MCPAKPARCPHDGCCVMLPRAALADHARGCMLRRVPCPLPGCGALVPVAALWQHLAWPEPRHVYLLAMQYCSLESSLGDATSRLAQAHLEHHAAALTPQHEQMESLRAQNAALRQRLAGYEPPADPEPPGSDDDDDAGEWEPVGQAQVGFAAPGAFATASEEEVEAAPEDAGAAPDPEHPPAGAPAGRPVFMSRMDQMLAAAAGPVRRPTAVPTALPRPPGLGPPGLGPFGGFAQFRTA